MRAGHPRPKFLSRNFCKNAIFGLISVLLGSLLATDPRGVRTGVWLGQNFSNISRKHPAPYQVCADIRHLTTAPTMRVENSAYTPFGDIWAQMWPKYEILVIDLDDYRKLPQAWKIVKLVQKGLGASICTLQAHFWVLGRNPKFQCFSPVNLQSKFLRCAIWVHILSPSPFFENFRLLRKK